MNEPKRPASRLPHSVNRLPDSESVPLWTDQYFNRSKGIVGRFGDKRVTYAVFMRRPVVSAPRLMIEWLRGIAAERGTEFEIELNYEEGADLWIAPLRKG